MDIIKFDVVLPALTDADVTVRELTVQIGDLPPDVRSLDIATGKVTDFEGEQNAPVVMSLVDIDDSGNRSEASTLSVTLSDVFPPAQPGSLSIVQTGEVVQ